jgi:hypothetical protein
MEGNEASDLGLRFSEAKIAGGIKELTFNDLRGTVRHAAIGGGSHAATDQVDHRPQLGVNSPDPRTLLRAYRQAGGRGHPQTRKV